ncbi:hypothetical protein [Streptomyces sp. NPDC047097]|uniref:hypothetical protein n=1 Tax=Streptomyces sp. NPDC047097 TaxID=3155260 RepID=UPI0033C55BDC
MTDTRSPLRALRAALFAAVCVTLAAVGHSSMSAHDVPPASLLLAFAATSALAWTAAGRRRGVVRIGAALVAAQAGLHTVFGLGQGHGHLPAHTHPDHAHVHEAMAVTGSAADGPFGELATVLHSGTTPGMAAAHLLAAAVCALWLARGEAAFFLLARTLADLAFAPWRPRPTAVVPPEPPRPPRPRARTPRRHRGVVLAHTLSRRGPPVLPAPRATVPAAAYL